MKTILTTICLIAATVLTAQHQYEVVSQQEIGAIKCTYIKAISGSTGKESYQVVFSFQNLEYHPTNSEISLSPELVEQFKRELRFSITYILEKSRDKNARLMRHEIYSLSVNGFLNRIYIYDHELKYNHMTVKEAQAILHWLNGLE
jgi:hypothetical protein